MFPAQGCCISLHIGGFKSVGEDKKEYPIGIFPKCIRSLNIINCSSHLPSY